MCMVACATILLLLINGKLKSMRNFFTFLVQLITKYFSDIFSLKTCNNEVDELGVSLIAECAL